ncbi:hypothetical protein [Streptomyces sp. NPDC000229]|uniref:hypothetical protein n=1 Tax=Streptomyces sp. NPDC000229 TaxID=3154247 RepID=UPI00332CD9AB
MPGGASPRASARRRSGAFDAVVGCHRLMAGPADPDRLHPAYAYEDGLHPDEAGWRPSPTCCDG